MALLHVETCALANDFCSNTFCRTRRTDRQPPLYACSDGVPRISTLQTSCHSTGRCVTSLWCGRYVHAASVRFGWKRIWHKKCICGCVDRYVESYAVVGLTCLPVLCLQFKAKKLIFVSWVNKTELTDHNIHRITSCPSHDVQYAFWRCAWVRTILRMNGITSCNVKITKVSMNSKMVNWTARFGTLNIRNVSIISNLLAVESTFVYLLMFKQENKSKISLTTHGVTMICQHQRQNKKKIRCDCPMKFTCCWFNVATTVAICYFSLV